MTGPTLPPRPPRVTEAHLRYLDDLRDSGATNMYGAAPYLRRRFPHLSPDTARAAVVYWMQTFSARHPQ